MSDDPRFNKVIELAMKASDAEADNMCDEAGMISLGELAALLERFDPDMPVEFSDGKAPGNFNSYRGYYRYIAINRRGQSNTVGKLLVKVRSAIGATFEGYKGGDFKMSRRTPVWVAEYGETGGGLGIVGHTADDEKLVLEVRQVEDY